MRTIFTTILFSIIALPFSFSQSLYFPPTEGDSWETMAPAELNWCPEKVDSLIEFVGEKNSKAFLILKDGKILLEHYYGSFTQDSLWYWASAGKSLMGTMIGLAQEDGFLDIEEPTANYLGEGWTSCSPEDEAKIKIRHQISMATGLDDSLEEPGGTDNCFDPECFECIADPETRWAYHNSPYRIVQDVMEVATGLDKTLYTRSRLGNRIGMKGAWFNYIYFSTARDMARFGLFTLAKGNWNGDIIFSDTTYFNQMLNSSQDVNLSYGYLWWLNGKSSYMIPSLQFPFNGSFIPEAPDDMVAALGKNDQKIYVVPSQNLVVVRQGNSAGTVAPAASSFDNQLWSMLMDMECLTATTEQGKNQDINVYPNPVKDVLTVTADASMQRIELYSVTGQKITDWQGNAEEVSLNVSNHPGGIYLVKIQTDAKLVTRKFVLRN